MKTANELEITQDELDALLVARDWLKTTKMVGAGLSGMEEAPHSTIRTDILNFNMANICYHSEDCGTVCCLGGRMAIALGCISYLGAQNYVISGRSPKLTKLFCAMGAEYSQEGMGHDYPLEEITPEEVLEAVNIVLSHGWDALNWNEILAPKIAKLEG